GLGLEFLRHVSRCRVLVYVIDLTSADPAGDLASVRDEVAAYDPELVERPSLVAGTKADLLPDGPDVPRGLDLVVSGVTGEGIDGLREAIAQVVRRSREAEPPRTPYVVLRPAREPFQIRRDGDRFQVAGRMVERWVREVDLDNPEDVVRLQRRLVRAGVERRLAEAGAKRGDEVIIGGTAFEFIPDDALPGPVADTTMPDTEADGDES
ncbi:MAG TPA: Obg family GTPase CgtA, partial [Actinomycetota bacterium]|nr:Obg family GTPase CgtA [Actinomycetota bacterium]